MPLLPMTDRKMGRPRQKLVENLARKIQICSPLFEFAEQDALPIQADGKTYIQSGLQVSVNQENFMNGYPNSGINIYEVSEQVSGDFTGHLP